MDHDVKLPLPLLIALQFLTRLPIQLPGMPAPAEQGRSLLWYPVVGLAMGAVLYAVAWLLGEAHVWLSAALLLTLWVAFTGGLHLDGLADSADAWVGGFGDRERTLRIMKDPCSGPIAVVVLLLVLLLKFCALVTLLEQQHLAALILAPLLGRAVLLGLFLSTPYVRSGGLGQALAEHFSASAARRVLLLVVLFCALFGAVGWVALVATAGAFYGLRRAMLQRLGGTTGDTAGALLELVECCVLVALALF